MKHTGAGVGFSMKIAGIGLALMSAHATIMGLKGRDSSEEGRMSGCRVNLGRLWNALDAYSDRYGGRFPNAWKDLERHEGDEYDGTRFFLCCPGVYDQWKWHPPWRRDPNTFRISYALEKGLSRQMYRYILAYDASPANHADGSRHILFANGMVEHWPAEREGEFQRRLDAQRKALTEGSSVDGGNTSRPDSAVPDSGRRPTVPDVR